MPETPAETCTFSSELENAPFLVTLKLTATELMHLVGTHDFPAPNADGSWPKIAVEAWLQARRLGKPLASGRVLDQWRLGFLSITEASRECKISPAKIYQLTRQKDFPEPSSLGYSRQEIDAWIKDRSDGIPLSNGSFLRAWKPANCYTRKEVTTLLDTSDTQLGRWIHSREFPGPIAHGLWDKQQVDNNPITLRKQAGAGKKSVFFDRTAIKKDRYTLEEVRARAPIPLADMLRYLEHNPPQFPWPIDGTDEWDGEEFRAWLADREAGYPIPGTKSTLPRLSTKMTQLRRQIEEAERDAARDGVKNTFREPGWKWIACDFPRYGKLCTHCVTLLERPKIERCFSVPEFAPYCSADHKEKHALWLAKTAEREAAHATVPYLFRSSTKPYILQKCAHKNCAAPQASDFSSKYCVEHDNLFKLGRLEEKKPAPLPPVALSAAEKERLAASQQPPSPQKPNRTTPTNTPEEIILTPEEIKGNAELEKMLKDLDLFNDE